MIKFSSRDKKCIWGKGEYKGVVDVLGYYDDIREAAKIYPHHGRAKCNYPNGCVVLDFGDKHKETFGSGIYFEFPEKVEYI